MVEGRRKEDWRRTARVCQVMANIHRNREAKPTPYTDDDFNPFAEPVAPVRRIKAPITILKQIFLKE